LVLLADVSTPGNAEGTVMPIVANRYWILLALLAAAVVSYVVGSMFGLAVFIAAGAVLELAFWIALIRRRRRRKDSF
jgi:hypothetical protein